MFLQRKNCHPYITDQQIASQRSPVLFLRSTVTTLSMTFHLGGAVKSQAEAYLAKIVLTWWQSGGKWGEGMSKGLGEADRRQKMPPANRSLRS